MALIGGWGLTSCSYQIGTGELSNRYTTISIPYIEGDQEGELTAELIRQLSISGAFEYRPIGGALIVKVKVIELSDENIGFRYDREKKGNLKKAIIPTETRLTALAEVTVIEAGTNQVIRGPIQLSASVEFDHDYYRVRDAENIFSLGQLSDVYAAHDAVMYPLNRSLAEKITSYVLHSW